MKAILPESFNGKIAEDTRRIASFLSEPIPLFTLATIREKATLY